MKYESRVPEFIKQLYEKDTSEMTDFEKAYIVLFHHTEQLDNYLKQDDPFAEISVKAVLWSAEEIKRRVERWKTEL